MQICGGKKALLQPPENFAVGFLKTVSFVLLDQSGEFWAYQIVASWFRSSLSGSTIYLS